MKQLCAVQYQVIGEASIHTEGIVHLNLKKNVYLELIFEMLDFVIF